MTSATQFSTATNDLFDQILAPQPPGFALLYRPESTGRSELDVLVGEVREVDSLAELPIPDAAADADGHARHDLLAVIPFRQITERGFACVDDGEPVIAMTVTRQERMKIPQVLSRIPAVPVELTGEGFDLTDDAYADTVRKIIAEEIGQGEGSNFVLKRSFTAEIPGYSPHSALSFFARLLAQESGAYWTFIVHTGARTFVGASPERHISLRDGTATMNPISGTYRYPPSGPNLSEVMEFLSDRKEADELYMVVDEELKMMARICTNGGRVIGPYLKEMGRLAHTEYFIEGHSSRDVRTILRTTMFAPTVTGSPLENACRVISRYEPQGRGYYSGVAALIGRDHRGDRTLDSSILIRTADIDHDGRLRIDAGSTLVRHSDPDSEAAETRAKAAGLLAALGTGRSAHLGKHAQVRAALERRNVGISRFWLEQPDVRARPAPKLVGRTVLIVDAEDTFTAMIDHQLRAMGMRVTVRRFDEPYSVDDHDITIMGPGPGDPRDGDDPKIAHLQHTLRTLLARRRPFLAVCLSHQVLTTQLGFDLIRRQVPNQGVQREIDLFGRTEQVGFYNTFAARSEHDEIELAGVGRIELSRDTDSGEVHAVRGRPFASVQFHAESVLTEDGVGIVGGLMTEILES
jgi:phenazine biosynthesis protein phzE